MSVTIARRTATSVLFVRPRHYAHRPLRAKAELLQQLDCFPRGDDSTTIVHCALADIPRIDVAAKHHHFVRLFRSDELGDNVPRWNVGKRPRAHSKIDPHFLSAVCHAMQHRRILHAERGCRNLRDSRVIVHGAGMRILHCPR